MVASLSTREAAAVREDCARKWRDHRQSCVKCEKAARSRRPREMCDRGRALNSDRAQAEADYRKERDADKQPNPDQEVLFPVEDVKPRPLTLVKGP